VFGGRAGASSTGGSTTGGRGPIAVCGNGLPELGEQCDDGNQVAGDGCAPNCVLEAGYNCSTLPCHRVACNDGVWECFGTGNGSYQCENCEDGNTLDGDGCSASCLVEPGWICSEAGKPCRLPTCGDNIVETWYDANGVYHWEDCEDGNTQSGDGCSSSCQIEAGWYCYAGVCNLAQCGNGVLECFSDGSGYWSCESCDDGNSLNGDGCSSLCEMTPGWLCPVAGTVCHYPRCGDGILDTFYYDENAGVYRYESCDDGNLEDGDGCSSTCQPEPGWICAEPGKPCRQPTCGDGFADGWTDPSGNYQYEECDDGNQLPGDGCSPTCVVEAGWYCLGALCAHPNCGNGSVECSSDGTQNYTCEECDDGNGVAGDGCSPTCTAEFGYNCWSGSCYAVACNDGVWDCFSNGSGSYLCEDCEDGNTQAGDGCSASCLVEAGWYCNGSSCTQAACPNGVPECQSDGQGNYLCEECDDSNGVAGDGCSPTCTAEAGYNCWSGSCYAVACNDGVYECFSDGNGGYQCEDCEDGNLQSGDGCSATCVTEAGYDCSSGICRRVECGNGVIECSSDGAGNFTCEECDDGNTAAGDGCGSDCRWEPASPGSGGTGGQPSVTGGSATGGTA
jgi:cysteine-rich repeat protein